jgi:hypothetical protein
MDRGELFPLILDRPTRETIKQTIIGLEVIIPTIKLFYENAKYLEIEGRIIKVYLFNNRLPRRTIYQLMELIWSPPEYVLVES